MTVVPSLKLVAVSICRNVRKHSEIARSCQNMEFLAFRGILKQKTYCSRISVRDT